MRVPRIFSSSQIRFSPVIWVTIEKLTQQGMWLLLFLILAPLLGPKPYGVFAIAMVFVGFFEIAIVAAAVEALVTITDLDASHLRTVNLCSIAAAIFAGAIIFGSADFLAQWFDSVELRPALMMLAPLPTISALTSVPIAILSRQSRFDSLALRSIVGLAIGGAVGVGFALSGAGVQSLVAQILAQRGTELGMLWASPHTRVGLGWSRLHFTNLRGYVKNVLVSRTMSWAVGQIPRSILGWYLGPVDLGLFALASRLVDMIMQVVIVPRSSVARIKLREFNKDPTAMARAFNILVRETAILSFPISCGLASIVPTVFAALLDNRWQPGIVPAQIMALTVIPLTFYYCSTAVLLAAQKLHLDSQSHVVLAVTCALTVLVAAPFGINSVCSALLLQNTAFLLVPLTMVRRACGSSPFVVIWEQLPLLGAAGIMGLGVTVVAPLISLQIGHMATIPVLIGVGVAIYIPLAALAAPNDIRRLIHRVTSTIQWAITKIQ